jgi:hypothetical protein
MSLEPKIELEKKFDSRGHKTTIPPFPGLYRKISNMIPRLTTSTVVFLLCGGLASAAVDNDGYKDRASTTSTSTADNGLFSFLHALDHHRKSARAKYSYTLNSLSNFTRVDLPLGDHQRHTSTIGHGVQDWVELTPVPTASVFPDAVSSWFDPVYYVWYLTHLFHTTTVTVSCHAGGEHGDVDLDAYDGCELSALRIDVNRDDNAMCQWWDKTDVTGPTHLGQGLYHKASFAYHHNRFPTKSDLGGTRGARGGPVLLTPGKSVRRAVQNNAPTWLVGATGLDDKIEHVFGFCHPCTNDEGETSGGGGGGGCGSPPPQACTQHEDSYGDWVLRGMGWHGGGNGGGNGVGGNPPRPSLCGAEAGAASEESKESKEEAEEGAPSSGSASSRGAARTVLHPYTCTEESCTFTLSPYYNPVVRVVDVHNTPTQYWLDVHTQGTVA